MMDFFEKMAETLKEVEGKILTEREIEYPIEINGIKKLNPSNTCFYEKAGSFVSIRPVAEQYEQKTFLGLYLGDLILRNNVFFNKETKMIEILPHRNPAIFVFNLNRIIWGCESWWGFIKSEDDLKQITDADINNIWYVKALKELHGHKN